MHAAATSELRLARAIVVYTKLSQLREAQAEDR